MKLVSDWENGKSKVTLVTPISPEEEGGEVVTRTGTNHSVTVQEDVGLIENQKD